MDKKIYSLISANSESAHTNLSVDLAKHEIGKDVACSGREERGEGRGGEGEGVKEEKGWKQTSHRLWRLKK